MEKLKNLLDIRNGFAFKSSDYSESGLPVVRISDIKNSQIFADNCKKIPESKVVEGYWVEKGDILIAMSGATTGKYGIYGSDEPALQNQRVGKFTNFDTDLLLKSYFFYYLDTLKEKIYDIAYGGAQKNISSKQIKEIDIPLPSLEQQHRIVAKIEELFSELDNGVANLEKTRAQLQTYRQSVLKHAFEGALTEEWRTNHAPTSANQQANLAAEPQPHYQANTSTLLVIEAISQEELENLPGPELLQYIKAERQRQYEKEYKAWQQQAAQAKQKGQKKPAKPKQPKEMEPLTQEELSQLPELPEGWFWARLGDISNAIGGYAFKSKNLLKEGIYQVIKIANVKMGHLDLKSAPAFLNDVDEQIIEKYGLTNGDIVISLTGTRKKRDYGDVAIVENQNNLLLNQRLGAIRFDEPLYPRFFFYAMMTDIFRDNFFNYETGNVGQGNVSMKALVNEPIFFPPLKEQKQIVREIESRLSVADNMEASIDQSLQQAQSLRQSILKKAFEGELVNQEEQVEAETS